MDEGRSRETEVSARSVDAAIAEALEQLGLDIDQVEIEIIKQGSRGLFGLLREDAVVRVKAKVPWPMAVEPAPEPAGASEDVQAGQAATPPDDEIAALGTEILQTLLSHMGLRAGVVREETRGTRVTSAEGVRLNVVGDELGVLIGRRGETLRDLQYLTCLLVSRRIQHWPDLSVDVENYKARREQSLIELARRMADRVRSTSEAVQLEPMPAYDRRIVHLALRDDPEVFTESYGQDDKRKVVILPRT